jgi:hypothetical protein
MNELKQALPDIVLERDCVRFDGTDAEKCYYATGEPATLWQLDYRNHTEETLLIRAFWLH